MLYCVEKSSKHCLIWLLKLVSLRLSEIKYCCAQKPKLLPMFPILQDKHSSVLCGCNAMPILRHWFSISLTLINAFLIVAHIIVIMHVNTDHLYLPNWHFIMLFLVMMTFSFLFRTVIKLGSIEHGVK